MAWLSNDDTTCASVVVLAVFCCWRNFSTTESTKSATLELVSLVDEPFFPSFGWRASPSPSSSLTIESFDLKFGNKFELFKLI